ncbi:MAG TPA: DUF1194 domain-containing protein [Azospirillum sp.]|nr:DUF1194 domain-containing protein [Azospirillum sp.]
MLKRLLFAVLLIAATLPAAAQPLPQRKPQPLPSVGLELVLLVDGSASITVGDLEFQLRGHAAAFADPEVAEALAGRRVAVTLAVFSGPKTLRVLVPWTVIAKPEDAQAFASNILAAPRDGRADSTAIGSAIEDSVRLFASSGVRSERQVIDLVANGFSNAGLDPAAARDRAVALGITINALAILDEFPWLEEYFAENVIGGANCFVKSAMDRDTFVEALRQKLVLEVAALPLINPRR